MVSRMGIFLKGQGIMHKIRIYKIAVVFMAIVLFVSAPSGVLTGSAAAPACNCGSDPVIYVTGIASIDIVKNPGTAEAEVLFPPSIDKIKSAIDAETVMNLAKFAVTRDWDAAADALIPIANKALEDFACNPDGTVKDGTGVHWTWPSYSTHSPNYAPGFYYDWREDPMDIALELKDYIEYVCSVTGHEKVNLIAYSMGSITTMSYLYQFGYDRIAGLVLSAAALNGVSCAGEPFSGNVEIDPAGIVRYVDGFMHNEGKEALITALVKVLQKAGLVGVAVDAVNNAIEKLADRVYPEVLAKCFGTSPGMWSLIPDEYYEDAKKLLLSDTETYGELIKRIDNYHYNVQVNNGALIDGAIERGINFGNILKYNLQGFPCGNSVDNSTDAVIDAKYASFGATIAGLESDLGDNYVQSVNCGHNHISPDNKIDASTCRYPEQTWFVRDFVHMRDSADYDALINYIFFSEEHVTVFDNEKYPQFLVLDEKTNTMSPLTAGGDTGADAGQLFGENSWINVLINFFTTLFAFLRQTYPAS